MVAPDLDDFLEAMRRRGYLLAELGGERLTKPELESRLDVSRSTIDRGIRELESMAMVERTDEGYRQTLSGKLALREYATFTRRIAGLYRGSDLLSSLSRDTPFDLAMLQGGSVVEADRTDPHRPAEALYGLLESASAVRGFATAIHPQQVATYREQVRNGMELELVLTEAVVERLLSKYADAFESVVSADQVTILQSPGTFPYGLTVARTDGGPVAAVMIYTDDGGQGCIINDATPAVEWAERRYEAERGRARPLT